MDVCDKQTHYTYIHNRNPNTNIVIHVPKLKRKSMQKKLQRGQGRTIEGTSESNK